MALTPDQQRRMRMRRMNMMMAYAAAFAAGRAAEWTPEELFAAGEIGAWYDPSDFSTMFQDSAGTTPVTAVEQAVGRILDKSGNGNHASQSTPTARPTLSARVNLLTYSEQFDNAAWSKTGCTVDDNATTDPLGGSTADKLISNAATGQTNVGASVTTVAAAYTFSVCAKADQATILQLLASGPSTGFVNFDLSNGTVGTATTWTGSITSLGGGWYRCTATTEVVTAAASTFRIGIVPSSSSARAAFFVGNGTDGLFLWGADLRPTNQTTGLPAYQRIAAATDYDTTGFPLYLRFDGTDDFLVTGTINPGAVDKVQVFAGVRKLSDAAQGVLAEWSATIASNNGTFLLAAPDGATATFGFDSKGTTQVDAVASSLTAPLTRVVTGLGDISGDTATIRINGVQADQDTGDQGTGNYASAIMYIGRRAGTTLPLNGHVYSLAVRFSATNLSDAVVAQMENWVAGKTGVTL